MKKVCNKLLQVLFICLILLVVSGCQYDPYKDKVNVVVETDYFYVQLVIKDGQKLMGEDAAPYALILELTDLGKEQEIIVIPEYIEGLVVKQIGRYSWPIVWGLESENLKKVYITTTVNYIERAAFSKCTNLEEVVMLSVPMVKGASFNLWSTGEKAKLIFSDPLQDNTIIVRPSPTSGGKMIPVNFVFHYHYFNAPNSGYYWFDYITGSNLYILPNNPEREGYTFKGWYIDEECSIEWDEVLPISETEILELYALWE